VCVCVCVCGCVSVVGGDIKRASAYVVYTCMRAGMHTACCMPAFDAVSLET
jgi:hypothetical protein